MSSNSLLLCPPEARPPGRGALAERSNPRSEVENQTLGEGIFRSCLPERIWFLSRNFVFVLIFASALAVNTGATGSHCAAPGSWVLSDASPLWGIQCARLKDALYLSVCRSEVDQSQTPAVWITRCLRARHISLRKKKKIVMFIYLFILSFFSLSRSPVEWAAFRNIQGSYTSAAEQERLLLEWRNASLFPEFSCRDILNGWKLTFIKNSVFLFHFLVLLGKSTRCFFFQIFPLQRISTLDWLETGPVFFPQEVTTFCIIATLLPANTAHCAPRGAACVDPVHHVVVWISNKTTEGGLRLFY